MRAHLGSRSGSGPGRWFGLVRHAIAALLVVVVTALSQAHQSPSRPAHDAAQAPYTLLQMNLCLSGQSGCYERTRYPAVVTEAITRITESRADAVTLNEICSGDVSRIAQVTGYHLRFATVIYDQALLPCRDPGGRGLFGLAVLTRQSIASSATRPYRAQQGPEERRWLCVTTADRMSVCATHLEVRGSTAAQEANDGQCRELADVLTDHREDGGVIAAGDMNRDGSCAVAGMWTLDDGGTDQTVGIQQAYGDARRLVEPTVGLVPMVHTDHDALVVTARLAR